MGPLVVGLIVFGLLCLIGPLLVPASRRRPRPPRQRRIEIWLGVAALAAAVVLILAGRNW